MPGKWSRQASWPEGFRECVKCSVLKPYEAFHRHKQCFKGINTVCKNCRKPLSQQQYQSQSLEYRILTRARSRAKIKNLPCNIELHDIAVPKICPVLGIELSLDEDFQTSPSIDKIRPELGYTKGNIRIISNRANMLKNNASLQELELVLEDMKRL